MLKTTLALTLLATPAPAASTLDWSPCPGDKIGMECADLQVPLDWQKPDGRKITLKLGRLKATGTSEGSVLAAYGGPGAPGIAVTQQNPGIWTALRKRMTFVTWDTRGYGKQFQGLSTGLPCSWTRIPIPSYPRDDADWGRLSETNRGIAETCRPNDPEFFANMSSADQARDMEAIRKALGEPKLNYYGASYAGFYGQDYARLFPDKVRTMALDGTWSHSARDWNAELDELAKANQKFMTRFFASCACQKQWRTLIARANRNPIPAKDIAYNGRDLQHFGLGMAKQGQEQWPALTKAITQALSGDASGFVPPYKIRYPAEVTGITECLDWPRFAKRSDQDAAIKRLNRLAPDTGTAGTIAEGTLMCVGWPLGVTNPPTPLPKGLPPLLGSGNWGESDAVERVLAQVPGSTTVRHEGPGHTLYGFNECARTHIDRYLTEAALPPRGTTC